MYDKEDEALIALILKKRPDLTRDELERIILEKMKHKNVSRKTALYLLSIDLGIRLDSPVEDFIKINQLTDGLSNVRVIGRLLWLKETEKLKHREGKYTRGAIVDETGIANIIFWDRSKEELEMDGVTEGSVVEITNGYVKTGLSGRPEIHLTRRGNIQATTGDQGIPSAEDILRPVHELGVGEDYANVYGVVLSVDKIREVKIGDDLVKIGSFIIGSEDKSFRVVLWREAVDEYSWIKEGDKIIIFNGRVKLNKFNEIEIHISRNSHIKIYPGARINVRMSTVTISSISPGYNLNKLYVRVLAKGKKRINPRLGRESITMYVIDNTGDASLTLIGEASRFGDIIRIQDVLSIEGFRASIRGGVNYLFADDNSKIEINPRDMPHILPIYSIPFRKAKTITTMDKIVNVEGKIVEFLEASYDLDLDIEYRPPSAFIMEDFDGDPIRITFRGKLGDYIDETLEEGDSIRILGAMVDMASLLNPSGIPTLKLRAYSVIEKI